MAKNAEPRLNVTELCSRGFVSLWTTVASTGSCDCGRENLNVDKCSNTEGVSDLACYIKYIKTKLMSICEWKGNMSTSYTLYTKQRKCSCIAVHQKDKIWTSNYFVVVLDWNMTAHVIATSKDQPSCTYTNFSGIPSMMTMCGPHSKLTYKRSSGHLTVWVEWGTESKYIKNFLVKYREFNTTKWKEQQSKNNKECVLWNLTPSLPYELQTQCVPNKECAQCPLSKVIMVPPELTDAPSIQLEIQDHMQNRFISPGQRKVVVKWEYANSEAVANYSVTVRKVSGEPSNRDSFSTEDSSLTLILSYSAYNISIRALNSAGSSPVSSIAIEQMDEWRDSFGPFTVNITGNNSFSLSWSSSVSSVCYSVEWWAKGQIPAFRSFYVKQTHKEKTEKTESIFQPYTRYYFFLHIRPYQDTCNMKNVNDSETTYGTAQTYFTEGSPISAPGNVSILNITQHSSVITWSPVSEEDLRGFLLGYCIYLTEDNNETSFKVDPSINSYELQNLESNSAYRVQLSAFTAAGEGERSDFTHFVTKLPEFTALNSIIAAVVVGIIILLLAVHFSFRLLHRAKKLLWPSIPNPENSNAVQKIEIAYELGILEPLNRQRLEESEGCDSSTVCVVGSKREASPLSSPPTTLLLSEDEDSPSIPEEIAPPDIPTRESVIKETLPTDFNKTDSVLSTSLDEEVTTFESKDPGEIVSNTTVSDFVPASQPAVVFMSDYTTMEIFQQVTMTGIQGPSIQTVKPGLVAVHPGQDYVQQSYFLEEIVKEPPVAFNGTDVLNPEITVL
ncbi:interleukin-6 receptor subunit beta-like [Sinocyclocheilus anshuiensis]|uniref:interleukin-6 receptor subunit beta-like n=1 Tax=Sinocyclocheilus anshuiensis TaxID=1608454 RepID=UPI0007B9AD27|nr:PREDICTED: interleukin-6 receptor subunit beta-like [Sinocyclocheilus anshuiensis]